MGKQQAAQPPTSCADLTAHPLSSKGAPARYLLLTIWLSFLSYSLLAIRYSPLPSHFAAPSRGACGAPVALRMLATHPDRPAMTGGQTPHRFASLSRARLAFIAHPRLPLAAFDTPHIGPARPMGGEASCVTRRRVRSPLRRSTWDFWPGPVLAVIGPPPPTAFAREGGLRWSRGFGGFRTTRLKPLAKASRGSLGSPSGIVRLSSHGSSLPEGAGLADLPGTVASRIGDATASPAIQGSPHEAPLVSEVDDS